MIRFCPCTLLASSSVFGPLVPSTGPDVSRSLWTTTELPPRGKSDSDRQDPNAASGAVLSQKDSPSVSLSIVGSLEKTPPCVVRSSRLLGGTKESIFADPEANSRCLCPGFSLSWDGDDLEVRSIDRPGRTGSIPISFFDSSCDPQRGKGDAGADSLGPANVPSSLGIAKLGPSRANSEGGLGPPTIPTSALWVGLSLGQGASETR